MAFLPKNYEAPKNQHHYFKLQKWKNRIRVVSECLVGYEHWVEDWENKKPVRGENSVWAKDEKHFWAFCVYDYEDKQVKVLTVTQKSIQETITNILQIEWKEDITKYDLYINRTWNLLDTKYTVTSWDTVEHTDEIKKAIEVASKADLDVLYEGWHPLEGVDQESDEVTEF